MNTSTTTKNDTMKQAVKTQNYFGLEFYKNDTFDALNVAARLFLSLRITPEHAKKMVDMLRNGSITIEGFNNKTDDFIFEYNYLRTVNLSQVVKNKLDVWTKTFRKPTKKEFKYIEDTFNISIDEIICEDEISDIKQIHSAKDMAAYVKQFIKGQDNAIDRLAVPFFLHLDSKRKEYTSKIKTPVLVMGPTGSGKSELFRQFAKICDCPVIRINTSEITPNGWKGLGISDIIAREIKNGRTIKDLKYAVLIFNEFDKITHHNQKLVGTYSSDMDNDMMRDIMRLFETEHSLHIDDSSNLSCVESYKLPVDNLLIVFDGAFAGMDKVIEKRLNIGKRVGYSQDTSEEYDKSNMLQYVTNEDLIEWGYMPELLGRIGEVVVLNPLSTDIIYEIMTSAKENVLQSHIEFCMRNNIDLRFDENALRYIAEETYKSGLGFRNVKTLLSKALKSLYFQLPSDTSTNKNNVVNISSDYIKEHLRDR